MPSPGLVRAVGAYLERRRVLGTSVEVAAPVYVDVTVRAALRLRPRASPTETVRRARAALDQFFHPLTGGPDGTGWPLGRDVYRSEVLQVLDGTAGVEHVESLELLGRDGKALCGNVCVGPRGLVAAGGHEITAS
jgi:predicted phage baseplate assembly protein